MAEILKNFFGAASPSGAAKVDDGEFPYTLPAITNAYRCELLNVTIDTWLILKQISPTSLVLPTLHRLR